MRRGDIYTAAARGAYTGKPRSVVIVQDDRFDATNPVTVCPITTDPLDAPLTRIAVDATAATGLAEPSRIMVDKITTMPRDNLRDHVGRLNDADVLRLNRAIVTFLGIATGT